MLLVLGTSPVAWWICLLAILTGTILIGYTYLFFLALQKDDAPLSIAVFQTVPVFTCVWGLLFFHEVYGLLTYLGVGVVVAAVVLLTVQVPGTSASVGPRFSSALSLMVCSSFLCSIGYAVQKFLLQHTDYVTVFYWGRIGDIMTVSLLLLHGRIRGELVRTVRELLTYVIVVNVSNELLNSVAILVLIKAYVSGPLSIVSTLAATQPVFLTLLVVGINGVRRGTIPDVATRSKMVLRLALMGLLSAGIYLVISGKG